MNYNPLIHHRRSIRLKGYDYTQAGAYFITICVQNKSCLFGDIRNSQLFLNEAGRIIEKWWQKIPEKFPDIELDEYIVMPNHFHAIVVNVGANPRVRPNHDPDNAPDFAPNHDPNHAAPNQADPTMRPYSAASDSGSGSPVLGEHVGSPLHRVVQWFKTMTTNEYIRGVKQLGWLPFNGKLWQRNYYEHIIRHERGYQNIADYIRHNPAKWKEDMFFATS
ncbi:transposase [Botryobacter ruber]|uniref:transposase n=1 Tax=Botryobacter ruber TaxID=2171629 RepID=UPI000E0B8107|nr:transposase [Botryobacter ruber]